MFFSKSSRLGDVKMILFSAILLTVISLTLQPFTYQPINAQNASCSSVSSANQTNSKDLASEMKKLENSNDPADIATLAYIWGYPLVSVLRFIDYSSNPSAPPSDKNGPVNEFHFNRNLLNASATDIVSPNADTLYGALYLDLKNEPLVLKVPPIADRYFVIQFIDAYDNVPINIGTRTNVTSGGTYLITGPNWSGTVPNDLTQIKLPTNKILGGSRILVNGSEDVVNARELYNKFSISPLSNINSNVSQAGPLVSPQPSAIPITGISIFDEIGKDMIDNPPYSYDAQVVAKFKTIGVGSGLTPSVTANDTIKEALQTGIEEGEKLIDAKVNDLRTNINGWIINLNTGNYGSDYLLRAAIAKVLLGANVPQESVYPYTLVDSDGKNLTGTQKYVLHFDNNLPPVDAFWSLSMYYAKKYFVDNPINRNSIGDHTPGLKYNTDGSLDIYIQHDNPGKDKESNWLPSPSDIFNLTLRMYMPHEIVLKGEYQIPAVKVVS